MIAVGEGQHVEVLVVLDQRVDQQQGGVAVDADSIEVDLRMARGQLTAPICDPG